MHSLYRPGTLPDRRLLGRATWCCPFAGRAHGRRRRIAILGNAGGTVGARLRPLLPRHRGRRGRDRRRADRARAAATSTCATRSMQVFAEDARPWLERSRRRLRRDHGRRLPPALHPLLPGDHASSSSWPASGWRRAGSSIVNVGHPEGSDELERVLGRTMARGLPARPARSDRADQHAAGRRRGAGSRPRGCARDAATLPRDLRPLAAERGRGAWRRACRAARSTPTTARPVEWLVDRSLLEYANE